MTGRLPNLVSFVLVDRIFEQVLGFMYESKSQRPIARAKFVQRLGSHSLLVALMLIGSLGGVTQAGKFFAGLYALYAGLVFIAMAALLFTPFLHRLLHNFIES